MRKYFSKHYKNISYSIDSDKNKGLRNAQLGAVHAIASFFTLNQKIAAIIVMERMKEGYSKIRNEALAHAFAYMNLIEHWGSGIPRIIDKVKAAGLREPEFIGGEVDLRINIYRGQIDGTVDLNASNTAVKPPLNRRETADKVPANEQEQQIYKYVSENAGITTAQAMKLLGIKQRRTREILVKMVEKGWLRKEGASRSTIYVKNTEGR